MFKVFNCKLENIKKVKGNKPLLMLTGDKVIDIELRLKVDIKIF